MSGASQHRFDIFIDIESSSPCLAPPCLGGAPGQYLFTTRQAAKLSCLAVRSAGSGISGRTSRRRTHQSPHARYPPHNPGRSGGPSRSCTDVGRSKRESFEVHRCSGFLDLIGRGDFRNRGAGHALERVPAPGGFKHLGPRDPRHSAGARIEAGLSDSTGISASEEKRNPRRFRRVGAFSDSHEQAHVRLTPVERRLRKSKPQTRSFTAKPSLHIHRLL